MKAVWHAEEQLRLAPSRERAAESLCAALLGHPVTARADSRSISFSSISNWIRVEIDGLHAAAFGWRGGKDIYRSARAAARLSRMLAQAPGENPGRITIVEQFSRVSPVSAHPLTTRNTRNGEDDEEVAVAESTPGAIDALLRLVPHVDLPRRSSNFLNRTYLWCRFLRDSGVTDGTEALQEGAEVVVSTAAVRFMIQNGKQHFPVVCALDGADVFIRTEEYKRMEPKDIAFELCIGAIEMPLEDLVLLRANASFQFRRPEALPAIARVGGVAWAEVELEIGSAECVVTVKKLLGSEKESVTTKLSSKKRDTFLGA